MIMPMVGHRDDSPRGAGATRDDQWYKDAVIYELHVRAFADSNGDGVGDFDGLATKLGYLRDLGVTALWLLPFYPSPLRDGGYDIADYYGVQPDYGTKFDFVRFLEQAHEHGLKVIIELVINHTSTDHPWFDRARRAAQGTLEREFYVWSESPYRYETARVLFNDSESSNWAWDPVAQAYYWHRFYSHQPDLNFDSEAVQAALFQVVDHWLGLGVDGLRLDAIPYLFERDGTSCENLPETHAFLKKLRAHVDARFPGRMLLAEANQWPPDAASYFGDGDECHMSFHFPLMPRMFMAVHLEDAFPIVDILGQTPAIPDSCQWATFLRNHDELTLEMVTEEDRDYLYRVYARDHRARLNLGIRRRLAPLLGDRRRLELLNALLFSLPGTPVLYYGDEIGMGDNIYLGDRDGVRTPMQWNSDRNAGFSRANPQRLYLPVIVDPQFHFEAVNVETQQADPASFLWWMKYLIDLRTSRLVFSRGSLRFLEHDNAKVVAFVRELEDDQVLFVANLSRFAQYVTLFMGEYQGKQPFEMRGGGRFPRIDAERWGLSLGPYDHIWLDLRPPAISELPARESLAVQGDWWRVFEKSRDEVGRILAGHFRGRPWFRASGNELVGQSLLDSIRFECEAECFVLLLSQLEGVGGQREICGLPVGFAVGSAARELELGAPASVIAELTEQPADGASGQAGIVFDATTTRAYASQLLESLRRGSRIDGRAGTLRFEPRPGLEFACSVGSLDPRGLDLDQRVVFFGAQVVLKLLRVADEGVNAETEMLDFLSAHGARRLAPTLLGTVTWCGSSGEALLAIATEHVQNRGTALAIFADALQGHLERALSLPEAEAPLAIHAAAPGAPFGIAPSLAEPLPYLVDLLARRTAELHRTLSMGALDQAFAPEPFDHLHQLSLFHSARSLVTRTFAELRGRLPALADAERAQAVRVLRLEDSLIARLRTGATAPLEVLRIRSHGDLGLGDALFTGEDFVFIDFEGEATRPLRERRYKRCCLRDVAGVVRSIELLGGAMLEEGRFRSEDATRLRPWMESAVTWLASRFVETHSAALDETRLLPAPASDRRRLLRFYLFERCVQELAAALHSSASLTSALTGLERPPDAVLL